MTSSARDSRNGRGEPIERLHSACIHLLRGLRRVDDRTGLSPAALSALSVLVHVGPRSNKDLAAAEGVRPPTMTRIVGDLEAAGLARRETDETDRRSVRIRATPAGRRRLERGRSRRVARLEAAVAALGPAERRALPRAVRLLERVVEEERRLAHSGA